MGREIIDVSDKELQRLGYLETIGAYVTNWDAKGRESPFAHSAQEQ